MNVWLCGEHVLNSFITFLTLQHCRPNIGRVDVMSLRLNVKNKNPITFPYHFNSLQPMCTLKQTHNRAITWLASIYYPIRLYCSSANITHTLAICSMCCACIVRTRLSFIFFLRHSRIGFVMYVVAGA